MITKYRIQTASILTVMLLVSACHKKEGKPHQKPDVMTNKDEVKQRLETISMCGKSATGTTATIAALKRASSAMEAAGKGCIKLQNSFRSDMQQSRFKRQTCSSQTYFAVEPYPTSHETGLAFDVENHLEARCFLLDEGFHVQTDDPAHFYRSEVGKHARFKNWFAKIFAKTKKAIKRVKKMQDL